VVVVLVVGLLAALAWVLRPQIATGVDLVLDRVKGTEIVNPTGITASSSADGHPADNLRDGATNRYWSPAAPGDAAGQWVRADLAGPVRMVAVQLYNGSAEGQDAFLTTARVATLRLTVTRSTGPPVVREATLQDTPGPQLLDVGVSDVVAVTFEVRSAYGTGPGRSVSLAEIAFFKRS
jgi:hypothetical protein